MVKSDYGIKAQPIYMKIRNSLAHCCLVEGKEDGKLWLHDIKQFIKYPEYPSRESKVDKKKTLRLIAMQYYLDGEILYKQALDGTLLQCLDAEKFKRAL